MLLLLFDFNIQPRMKLLQEPTPKNRRSFLGRTNWSFNIDWELEEPWKHQLLSNKDFINFDLITKFCR